MLHGPAGEMRASNLTKDALIEPSDLLPWNWRTEITNRIVA